MKLKIAILVSGRGSNLQTIINSIESGKINAEIEIVISNKETSYALERAQNHNIDTLFIDAKEYPSREEYDKKIAEILIQRNVGLICLAGFMRIISSVLIKKFHNKIINIHPSLLPAFPGIHSQKQAIEYGVKFSGCTAHFVDEGVDTGPIILQASVPVLDTDTEETLTSKILKEEHRIYPEAIKLFSENRLIIKKRRVYYT